MSCGVLELHGLTADPCKVLYAIANHLYHPARGSPSAVLSWSDLDREGGNGHSLATFIRKNLPFCSQLFTIGEIENPKTSNTIRIWYYVIPHEAFRAWYVAERVSRARKT